MYKISILIPTLNNVNLLDLVIGAYKEYTSNPFEILVYANQINSEMKEYKTKVEVTQFLSSHMNEGVAKATNELFKLSTGDIILYSNDDMFPTPHWDIPLVDAFNDSFWHYITPIMYNRTHVPIWHSPFDYGDSAENFQKDKFLAEYERNKQHKSDIISAASPPFLKRDLWEIIGGFDERFYPGFGTDPDMAAKIYFGAQKEGKKAVFRGVTASTMYHFYDRGCSKLPGRDGYAITSQGIFKRKWKMSIENFYNLINLGNPINE